MNFFLWFWLWLNNLLPCNLTAEFSVAALTVSQDKSSGPCYLPMTLFPVQTPRASPDLYSSSISWRCLLEKEQMLQLGPKHSLRAAGPSPALEEEALAKSNIPKRSARLFLPKILHLCRSELGWRKTLDFVWNQMGGLKHIHWRTTTKRTKPTRGANLTLSTSSSRYMSLEKQPISNSWFEREWFYS